jgi:hypothetical protein
MRLNVLDKLDALIGDLDLRGLNSFCGSELIMGAKSIRSQFEAANETLYEGAHAEIALQGNLPALDRWLGELVNDGEAERPHPGLSFDLLDEIVSGVLQFRGPGEAGLLPSPEIGPCTCILQGQTWLTVNQRSDTERIAIFSSL